MDFTICERVVVKSIDSHQHLANILFVFTLNNSNRIVANKEILSCYKVISSRSKLIESWIDLMHKTNNWKLVNFENLNSNIFIDACLNTVDKKFIVDEKEDYGVLEKSISVLNKEEAIEFLRKPTISVVQKGTGHSATIGDNSPIIKK